MTQEQRNQVLSALYWYEFKCEQCQDHYHLFCKTRAVYGPDHRLTKRISHKWVSAMNERTKARNEVLGAI